MSNKDIKLTLRDDPIKMQESHLSVPENSQTTKELSSKNITKTYKTMTLRGLTKI